MLVEIQGTVEGQIDLEMISMERSGAKDRAVTITIPEDAIVIQDPMVDPKLGIKATTLHDPNVFHHLTDTQRNTALNHGVEHLKQKAVDAGIKAKTLDEAKHVIRLFLARSGVEVTFGVGAR